MNCPRCRQGRIVRFDRREDASCLACGYVQYDDLDVAEQLSPPEGHRKYRDPVEQVEQMQARQRSFKKRGAPPHRRDIVL